MGILSLPVIIVVVLILRYIIDSVSLLYFVLLTVALRIVVSLPVQNNNRHLIVIRTVILYVRPMEFICISIVARYFVLAIPRLLLVLLVSCVKFLQQYFQTARELIQSMISHPLKFVSDMIEKLSRFLNPYQYMINLINNLIDSTSAIPERLANWLADKATSILPDSVKNAINIANSLFANGLASLLPKPLRFIYNVLRSGITKTIMQCLQFLSNSSPVTWLKNKVLCFIVKKGKEVCERVRELLPETAVGYMQKTIAIGKEILRIGNDIIFSILMLVRWLCIKFISLFSSVSLQQIIGLITTGTNILLSPILRRLSAPRRYFLGLIFVLIIMVKYAPAQDIYRLQSSMQSLIHSTSIEYLIALLFFVRYLMQVMPLPYLIFISFILRYLLFYISTESLNGYAIDQEQIIIIPPLKYFIVVVITVKYLILSVRLEYILAFILSVKYIVPNYLT